MRSNPLSFTQQFLLLALTAAGLTACVDDVVMDADDPETLAESISLTTSGELVLYEGSCVSWTSLPRDLPTTVDTAVSYLTMTSRERRYEGVITTTITARTVEEQARYRELVSYPCATTAAWECTTWISHDSGHAEPMAVCTSGTITCGVGHGQGWCTGT
jgi:hypothetical protein